MRFGEWLAVSPYVLILVHSMYRTLYPLRLSSSVELSFPWDVFESSLPIAFGLLLIASSVVLAYLAHIHGRIERNFLKRLAKNRPILPYSTNTLHLEQYGIEPPKVLKLDADFLNALTLGRRPENTCIIITDALANQLSAEELTAVILHEQWHLKTDASENSSMLFRFQSIQWFWLAFPLYLLVSASSLGLASVKFPLRYFDPIYADKIIFQTPVGPFIILPIALYILPLLSFFVLPIVMQLYLYRFNRIGYFFAALATSSSLILVLWPLSLTVVDGMSTSNFYFVADALFILGLLTLVLAIAWHSTMKVLASYHREYLADCYAAIAMGTIRPLKSAIAKVRDSLLLKRIVESSVKFAQSLCFVDPYPLQENIGAQRTLFTLRIVGETHPDPTPRIALLEIIEGLSDRSRIRLKATPEQIIHAFPRGPRLTWRTASMSPFGKSASRIDREAFRSVINQAASSSERFSLEECANSIDGSRLSKFQILVTLLTLAMSGKIEISLLGQQSVSAEQ